MSNSYNELIKEIDQIKKKDKFQALKRLHEHINAVDADARLQKQIKQLEYEINNADIKKSLKANLFERKNYTYSNKQNLDLIRTYTSKKKELLIERKDADRLNNKKINKQIKTINTKLKELKNERKQFLKKIVDTKEEANYLESIKKITYGFSAILFKRISPDAVNKMPQKQKHSVLKDSKGYFYQAMYSKRSFQVTANMRDQFVNYAGKRVYDYNEKWDDVIEILNTDDWFSDDVYDKPEVIGYLNLIIFDKIEEVKTTKKRKYDITTEPNFNSADNNFIMFKYIEYKLNKDAKCFEDLFNLDMERSLSQFKKCFIDIIVNTYAEQINKFMHNKNKTLEGKYKCEKCNFSTNKISHFKDHEKSVVHNRFILTEQTLCELLDIEYNDDKDIGISLQQSTKFFDKFKISIVAVDTFCNIVFEHRNKCDNPITPCTLYLLIHNNHVYKLKCENEKSFIAIFSSMRENKEVLRLNNLSNKYDFQNFSRNKDKKLIFINDLDEVVDHIKNNEGVPIRFVTQTSLSHILFEMIDRKYIPQVTFENRKLSSLKFKIEKTIYYIQNPYNEDDTDHDVENNELKKFEDANENFYNWLINKNFLSKRSDQVASVEDVYKNRPLVGYFDYKYDSYSHSAVDRNKSYPSLLKELKYLPVFNEFDNYEKYDGHKIEDYTKYIVEVVDDNNESAILFDAKFSMIYGYVLNRVQHIKYNVLYFRRPSSLHDVNAVGNVNALFDLDINTESKKKQIAVITIGKLEKRKKKNILNKIFLNVDEAYYYAKIYNGKVHKLTDSELIIDTSEDEDDVYQEYSKRELYVLELKKECVLDEGFTPVKDFIYNLQRFYLLDAYRRIINIGLKPKGVNTDSVIVDSGYETLDNIFHFNSEIGGYKYEYDKRICNKKITLTQNELIQIDILNVQKINIQSEKYFDKFKKETIDNYNTEVKSILQQHNRVLISSSIPGAGKSTAAGLGCSEKEILYCTPYNMLAELLLMDDNEAITYNKLLKLRVDDSAKINPSRKHYDVQPFKRIVFDELLLCDPEVLSRLYRFMLKFPDKQIIATGDKDQLDCIKFNYNNISQQSEYIKKCVDILFPTQIHLTENKRLDTVEDKVKLNNLKNKLFNEQIDVMDTLKNYGFKMIKNIKQLVTKRNISYFKNKALEINQQLQKQQENIPDFFVPCTYYNDNRTKMYTLKYYTNQIIICRAHHYCKYGRLYVNVRYQITDINSDTVKVKALTRNASEMEFDISVLKKFSLTYCSTCHSLQGATIRDKFTIFHCNTPYVNRKYIWTAITRATSLDNITIFQHSEGEIRALEECKLKQYIKLKIENYKHQDELAKRNYTMYPFFEDEHYVDYSWYLNQKNYCHYCGENFYFNLVNGSVESNWSCDRLDNTKAHLYGNCVASCIHCNCSKK